MAAQLQEALGESAEYIFSGDIELSGDFERCKGSCIVDNVSSFRAIKIVPWSSHSFPHVPQQWLMGNQQIPA
jgi:hypothetical protein